MGKIKGQNEYKKWQKGLPLTRKQAILAHCYSCNGEESGREDCLGMESCELYQYFPKQYKKKKAK